MQCIEYTPDEERAPTEDDEEDLDPIKSAWRRLQAGWLAFKRASLEEDWRVVRMAYSDFEHAFIEECHTREDLLQLWAQSKTDPELRILRLYGEERDRRFAKSPKRREAKARYDAKNDKTAKRKAQKRAWRLKNKETKAND